MTDIDLQHLGTWPDWLVGLVPDDTNNADQVRADVYRDYLQTQDRHINLLRVEPRSKISAGDAIREVLFSERDRGRFGHAMRIRVAASLLHEAMRDMRLPAHSLGTPEYLWRVPVTVADELGDRIIVRFDPFLTVTICVGPDAVVIYEDIEQLDRQYVAQLMLAIACESPTRTHSRRRGQQGPT